MTTEHVCQGHSSPLLICCPYHGLRQYGMTHEEAVATIALPTPVFERRKSCRKPKLRVPAELRWAVWERDDFTCQHCGARRHLSIDHRHPESKGGEMTLENLQTLCTPCNNRKGTK